MLNPRTQKAMREFVEVFRKEFGLGTTVSYRDLIRTIEKMGGKVEEKGFWNNILDDTISYKTGDESFVIEMDASCSAEKKSFCVAHELGHLLFDMGYMIDSEKWDSFKVGEDRYHEMHKVKIREKIPHVR